MKIGTLADVHEDVGNLHKALAVLRAGAADRLIFLGDLCGRMTALEETVAALDDAGVVGVWGNHDLGLCADNPTDEDRSRYSPRLLSYTGRFQPRLEVAGCLFCHIEPWLDPTQLDDLWHFGGHPTTPERRDHIFAHTTHRVMFMGHYHTWLHVTPDAIHPWAGDTPIRLEPETRHMVVIHAISDGYCAPYDTETAVLTPFDLRRDD